MNRNNIDDVPDQALVKRINEGSEEAWIDLFSKYYSELLVAARRFTDREDFIEDAVIDVFMTLQMKGVGAFDSKRSSVFPYLLVSVRHRIIDKIRQENRRAPERSTGDVDRLASAEDEVLRAEVRQALVEAIQALPESQRQVLILRYLYGQRPREIADVLNISSARVSELLYAARTKLRRTVAVP